MNYGGKDQGLILLFVLSIGLIGGVAVSTFSKTLALVFGMLVFGVQVSDIGGVDMGDGRWGRLIGYM